MPTIKKSQKIKVLVLSIKVDICNNRAFIFLIDHLFLHKTDILLDKNPPKPPLGNFIVSALLYDLTRDSIANNLVKDFYCRCLDILCQIAIDYKI